VSRPFRAINAAARERSRAAGNLTFAVLGQYRGTRVRAVRIVRVFLRAQWIGKARDHGSRQWHDRQAPSSRAFTALLLAKILEDLNADFLRDRALDATHPIPEPDDFPLFLDVHEPTSNADSI
jgi:hypothetical protein